MSAPPCDVDDALGELGLRNHLAEHLAGCGVLSLGQRLTVLPIASGGTMWPLGRCGKLKGPMTAITPCGRKRHAAGACRCRTAKSVVRRKRVLGGVEVMSTFEAMTPARLASRKACRSVADEARRVRLRVSLIRAKRRRIATVLARSGAPLPTRGGPLRRRGRRARARRAEPDGPPGRGFSSACVARER